MASDLKKVTVGKHVNRIFVIIPAAGLGTRMNSNEDKQFMELDGVPVIMRTLEAFSNFSKALDKCSITLKAVVVTKEEQAFKLNSMCRYKKYDFVHAVVAGGATRTESVWKGIQALDTMPFAPNANDIVFIHDGARCLIDEETLERCLAGGLQYDICAAAVPVKSTIKQTVSPVTEPVKEEKPKEPEQASPAPFKFTFKFTSPLFQQLNEKKEAEAKEAAASEKSAETPAENSVSREPDLPPVARGALAHAAPKDETPSPFKKPEEKETAESARPAGRPGNFVGGRPGSAVIKETSEQKKVPSFAVEKTPDRSELMEVQTPQVFRYEKLVRSYMNGMKKNIEATDDTSLAEALNYKVNLVEGSYSNIKITTPEDLILAEAIIKKRKEESEQ